MKKRRFLLLIGLLLTIIACNGNKNPELSGVYATQNKSEYSQASDTLIITAISLENKTYMVENRTGYNRIRNGTLLPRQYKIQKWEATWNIEQQVLSEGDLGRQIRLSGDRKGILMKTTEFLKIN